MRVNVHRHADLTMAQKFLYYLGMHAHTEEQCCSAMPEIVEANAWQACLLKDIPEQFGTYVTRANVLTSERAHCKICTIMLIHWRTRKSRVKTASWPASRVCSALPTGRASSL